VTSLIVVLMKEARRQGLVKMTLLLACALCLASSVSAQEDAPVFRSVITPTGNILAAEDVSIIMRDGALISLDIYRPDGNARYATLYAAGPYPHNQAVLQDTTSEAGPVAWYVSQGYAVVLASVRGTGNSSGDYTFFSRQEQQDHYETIQWITEQSWSDGQVAGTGAGYYAASQWLMAIQDPSGLKCIAPINGTLDPLREWMAPGGLANEAFISDWYERRVRLPNAFAPGGGRLVDFDLRLAQLSHPTWDAWWEERSSIDSTRLITVPVFALNDWGQARSEAGLTSTLNAMAELNGINKLLVSNPTAELPVYQDIPLLSREMLPYYRWCFSGKSPSSPFIERPRIRYQVRGQDSIKRESNWPPGNVVQEAWFLNIPSGESLTGNLASAQPAAGNGFTNITRTDSDTTMRFVTPPLTEDVEISGPVMLELYAASTTNDMAFTVTVKEEVMYTIPSNGFRLPEILSEEEMPALLTSTNASTEILVTRGGLKASARLPDTLRSSEYLPVYAFMGRETLSPGQVYRQNIALRQTAYRFHAGNRILVEVALANDGSLVSTGRDTIYHNARYPSRLWLPVVQNP
jgi:predicted acyl esterase